MLCATVRYVVTDRHQKKNCVVCCVVCDGTIRRVLWYPTIDGKVRQTVLMSCTEKSTNELYVTLGVTGFASHRYKMNFCYLINLITYRVKDFFSNYYYLSSN